MSDDIKLIEIPLSSGEDVLEVNSNELPDDPAEIMAILQDERTDLKYWLQIAVSSRSLFTHTVDPNFTYLLLQRK